MILFQICRMNSLLLSAKSFNKRMKKTMKY
jgi:hypothetical protein